MVYTFWQPGKLHLWVRFLLSSSDEISEQRCRFDLLAPVVAFAGAGVAAGVAATVAAAERVVMVELEAFLSRVNCSGVSEMKRGTEPPPGRAVTRTMVPPPREAADELPMLTAAPWMLRITLEEEEEGVATKEEEAGRGDDSGELGGVMVATVGLPDLELGLSRRARASQRTLFTGGRARLGTRDSEATPLVE